MSHVGSFCEHSVIGYDDDPNVRLRTRLPVVGGKAAQLGELIRAGFAVPTRFCVTTLAYERISAAARLDALLAELNNVPRSATARWAALAASERAAILDTPIPSDIASAIRRGDDNGGVYFVMLLKAIGE